LLIPKGPPKYPETIPSKNRGRNQCEKQGFTSVVTDIQKIVTTEIKLPTDIMWNMEDNLKILQSAKARLMIAVPLALFNIYPIVFCFWFRQRILMFTHDTAVSRWRRTVFIHERTAI
jgi:hypothetical protein